MRIPRWTGWIFAALALAAPGFAVSQGNATDTFVKGTTDFLLDRANDNYIYIFQRKLEGNSLLQKYLPDTLRVAKAGDLQSLIMHKELWKEALRSDLVGQGNKLFAKALGESTGYIETLCEAELKKDLSVSIAKDLADRCNNALERLKKVLDKWEARAGSLCKAQGDKESAERTPVETMSCEDAPKQIAEVRERISNAQTRISRLLDKIPGDRKETADAQSKPVATAATPDPKGADPPRALVYFTSPGSTRALEDLTRDLDGIRPESCTRVDAGKYTGCVIEILAILRAVAHADYVVNCYMFGNMCSNGKRDRKNANFEESDDFADFQRYALFFAQLADAAETSDRARVNALLKSVTIPPVSFGIKREPHATRVLVTAYVGMAWSRQTAASHDQALGILAPLGFEISQARDSGNSLSLFVSPLDFGYPLTLKLKDTETTIKGSDVVVPSAYVFYGWKNYPFAAGLGYTRGRGIDNPDERVGRVVVLFAFDMPLFKLH
jgi:hypothetical protein